MAERMTQTGMHFPDRLLDRMDEAAKRAGMSRAAWVRDACRAKLAWEKMTREEREKIMQGVDHD